MGTIARICISLQFSARVPILVLPGPENKFKDNLKDTIVPLVFEVEGEDEQTNKSKLCGNLSPFCCLTIAQNWISKKIFSDQFHPCHFIL